MGSGNTDRLSVDFGELQPASQRRSTVAGHVRREGGRREQHGDQSEDWHGKDILRTHGRGGCSEGVDGQRRVRARRPGSRHHRGDGGVRRDFGGDVPDDGVDDDPLGAALQAGRVPHDGAAGPGDGQAVRHEAEPVAPLQDHPAGGHRCQSRHLGRRVRPARVLEDFIARQEKEDCPG